MHLDRKDVGQRPPEVGDARYDHREFSMTENKALFSPDSSFTSYDLKDSPPQISQNEVDRYAKLVAMIPVADTRKAAEEALLLRDRELVEALIREEN
jgi:hypothetical protein